MASKGLANHGFAVPLGHNSAIPLGRISKVYRGPEVELF